MHEVFDSALIRNTCEKGACEARTHGIITPVAKMHVNEWLQRSSEMIGYSSFIVAMLSNIGHKSILFMLCFNCLTCEGTRLFFPSDIMIKNLCTCSVNWRHSSENEDARTTPYVQNVGEVSGGVRVADSLEKTFC